MDLTLETEAESVLNHLEVDLTNICQLVSRVLENVELCAEKTVNGEFALLNAVSRRDWTILHCARDVCTLRQIGDVDAAHHFP